MAIPSPRPLGRARDRWRRDSRSRARSAAARPASSNPRARTPSSGPHSRASPTRSTTDRSRGRSAPARERRSTRRRRRRSGTCSCFRRPISCIAKAEGPMDRRTLLKAAALGPVALLRAGNLFAAPASGAKLLIVFLRGGYDAANVLVPVSSPFYYESRPNIAVAKPGSDANAAITLDADWGLHPALAASILPLYERKQVAFVPFAGTEDLSRSHFETQDSIELGQPLGAHRDFQSGFLNRLVGAMSDHRGMSFTDQLPLIFRGDMEVPNMAMRSLARPGVDARQSEIIREMYRGTRLESRVNEGFNVRDAVMQDMAGEMEAASRNAITTKGFELEARRVAKLMRDRFDIGFLDIGGWDTHVGEGGASGYLAGRFEELGRGLAAIAEEMGAAWQDVVVVVISEFGRTFRENGNRGTDHGHGTVYWALGGGIRGGRVPRGEGRVEAPPVRPGRRQPGVNPYPAP